MRDVENVVAHTLYGRVRGERRDSVTAWLGVPYAQPPVGKLRWLGPRQLESRTIEYDATRHAAMSLQPAPTGEAGASIGAEDCLYLDIYAPSANSGCPVLVWIHGGGGITGAAREYDGSAWARAGVVFVAIGYRLGALGLADLRPIYPAAESNLATRDQLAALTWIAQNIAAFGGDPSQLTLAGQSNGARSVINLMATSGSEPLFHRAVALSPTGGGELSHSKEQSADLRCRLLGELASLGISRGMVPSAPASALLEAQHRLIEKDPSLVPLQAHIDDDLFKETALDTFRAGRAAPVPLIIGATRDEYDAFCLTGAEIDTNIPIRSLLLNKSSLDALADAIPANEPAAANRHSRLRRAASLADWWAPAVRLAIAHSTLGWRTHLYRFDRRLAPEPSGPGAIHGIELPVFGSRPLVFGRPPWTLDRLHRVAPAHAVLRENVLQFVKTGWPATAAWEPYTPARSVNLRIDDRSLAVGDLDIPGRWL